MLLVNGRAGFQGVGTQIPSHVVTWYPTVSVFCGCYHRITINMVASNNMDLLQFYSSEV